MAYRYFISLAYNGAAFHGWQVQDNAITVQQVITGAINMMWKTEINLVGCGRTDTGVHARQFYAHFDLGVEKSKDECDELAFRLNRFLPRELVIYGIFPVPADLHARFNAIARTYEYHIHTFKDPFLDDLSWFVHDRPDVELMNAGARMLTGTGDYTSFSKLHSAAKTNICTVIRAEWNADGHRLVFSITADRFLRNMVRAIIGTLVDLGQGKLTTDGLQRIIDGRDRSLAGESVPAKGLFLVKVEYPPPGNVSRWPFAVSR